jgi:hypothetical protein
VAEVVLQIVALILERVETLVLDLPTGSAAAHDIVNGLLRESQVGDPTEILDVAIGFDLPIFENIHQAIGLGFVERHLKVPSIVSEDVCLGIDLSEVPRLPGIVGFPDFLEQIGMVARLDADDVIGTCFGQVAQVWSIAAEGIFDDNDRQMGMIGSGASGMTSLRSGWTMVAPRS